MIDVRCPFCHEVYHADESQVGSFIKCRNDGSVLPVRRAGDRLQSPSAQPPRATSARQVGGSTDQDERPQPPRSATGQVNSWQSQPEAVPAAPMPPSLAWGWLCALVGLTFGIFLVVWMLVQSFWVRKIDPKSKATLFYTLAALTYVALFVIGNVEQKVNTTFQMVLQTGLWWAGAILYVVGSFSIKRSLEWYYNTCEPINLHLSSPMVFLFGTVYFQYYLSEISHWKKTGTLSPD